MIQHSPALELPSLRIDPTSNNPFPAAKPSHIQEVIPELELNPNLERPSRNPFNILGTCAGRLFHLYLQQAPRRPPDSPPLTREQIVADMLDLGYQHLPSIPDFTDQEIQSLTTHILQAHATMAEQVIQSDSDPNYVIFKEWSQHPSHKHVIQFINWWNNPKKRAFAENALGLSPSALPELMTELFTHWSTLLASTENPTALQTTLTTFLDRYSLTPEQLTTWPEIRSERELWQIKELQQADRPARFAFQLIYLAAKAQHEVSQYLGGTTNLNQLLSDPETGSPHTPATIQVLLERAMALISPDEDLDFATTSSSLAADRDQPLITQQRERLLFPPYVIPDRLQCDFSHADATGLQIQTELELLRSEEEDRPINPNSPKVFKHPNLFHIPRFIDLMTEGAKHGMTYTLEDFKTSLFEPGKVEQINHNQKFVFYLMALAQNVISHRRQTNPQYDIYDFFKDPLFIACQGTYINYCCAHLDHTDLNADPTEAASVDRQLTLKYLWDRKDLLASTQDPALHRKIIKNFLKPFMVVKNKILLRLKAREYTYSSKPIPISLPSAAPSAIEPPFIPVEAPSLAAVPAD